MISFNFLKVKFKLFIQVFFRYPVIFSEIIRAMAMFRPSENQTDYLNESSRGLYVIKTIPYKIKYEAAAM